MFLDLHVWLPGALSLTEAHAISHAVKDRLMARYPQIVDAVIPIEPPPVNRTIRSWEGESGTRLAGAGTVRRGDMAFSV